LYRGFITLSSSLLKISNSLLFTAKSLHKISIVDTKIISCFRRLVTILAKIFN
jgi:hypothetical protein